MNRRERAGARGGGARGRWRAAGLGLLTAVVALLATGCATSRAVPGARPALPVEVSGEAQFGRLALASPRPVLVVFHSHHCPYCRTVVDNQLPKIGGDFAGRLSVVTVDTAALGGLADRYGVRGIPVLLILQQGREVRRINGYRPYFWLRRSLEAAVAEAAVR